MSHVNILLDYDCLFHLEFYVKNVIQFFVLNGSQALIELITIINSLPNFRGDKI